MRLFWHWGYYKWLDGYDNATFHNIFVYSTQWFEEELTYIDRLNWAFLLFYFSPPIKSIFELFCPLVGCANTNVTWCLIFIKFWLEFTKFTTHFYLPLKHFPLHFSSMGWQLLMKSSFPSNTFHLLNWILEISNI